MSQSYAILCPGQGSQKLGMAAELMAAEPTAATLFNEASDILGYDLAALCTQGPQEKLDQTQFTQPALYVTTLALWTVYGADWSAPTAIAGHSLGEISALAIAGAIGFAEGLRVVQKRGELMSQAAAGAMAAVMKFDDIKTVEKVSSTLSSQGLIQIANYNSPGQLVVTGDAALIKAESTAAAFKAAGIKRYIVLPVSGAFHSPLMQPSADTFLTYLRSLKWTAPRWPVISNVTAQAYASAEQIPEQLAKHLMSPVRWTDCLAAMAGLGIRRYIELGSGTVLAGLVKQNLSDVESVSIQGPADLGAIQTWGMQ